MSIYKELEQSSKVVFRALVDLYERVIAPGITAEVLLVGIIALIALLFLSLAFYLKIDNYPSQGALGLVTLALPNC